MDTLTYPVRFIAKMAMDICQKLFNGLAQPERAEVDHHEPIEDISTYHFSDPEISRSEAMPWERDDNESFY